MAPFEWAKNFNYEKYEKNIMNEDIIPDDLFTKIQQIISSYCGINYTTVKTSHYSGHSRDCNDNGGNSECSCDISGTYCYPANCSTDDVNPSTCKEYNSTTGICGCNNCQSTYTADCPGHKNAEEDKED